MTQQDTNTSPTVTTSTVLKKTSYPSYHLRHISDDVTYPYLGLSYHLSGPPEDTWGYGKWLGRAGCRRVDDPLRADFVIFAGGPDVSPHLYGAKPISETCAFPSRDKEDMTLYALCVDNRIPMVGVCRGAQFLWTRQGGILWQDVDNHNNGHHNIFHFKSGKRFAASSVHHQACRPENLPGMKLLANATESRTRKTDNIVQSGPASDFEIFAFPDEAILCFQGHPEYPGYPQYSKLCIELIEEYIYDNPATEYLPATNTYGSRVRVKENA